MKTQRNNEIKHRIRTRRWASTAGLTLGLTTFGLTLGGGVLGCHHQNQDEVQQLRAQVKALQAENEALKAQQAPAQPAAAPEAAQAQATAPGQPAQAAPAEAQPPTPKFEDALKTFNEEKRDNEWARLREVPLLNLAKEHIQGSGASLNSVQCKTTACLIIIDVPPKKDYQVMTNPWADTPMATNQKEIWDKRTRYSYLLIRHAKDDPKQGEARVDPLKLQQERTAAKEGDQPASVKTTTRALKPAAAKPAPAAQPAKSEAQKPAAEASAKPQQPATQPPAAQKPAAQPPAAQKPAAQPPAQKPAAEKPAAPAPAPQQAAPVKPAK